MLLWFPLLLCVHACMQSTQGHVNVCNVLYCSLSCVWESDVSRHPYPIDTHSLCLFNTHTDTHTTRASQLESVRRLNISQWVETWQRHWVHLNVSLCETRGLWKKYTPQNITHTHARTYTVPLRSEEVSDRGVGGGGDCVVWMFAFVRWAMSFFLLLYERRGEGESDWSKSMQGERMPGRCHLTPSLPFSSSCVLSSFYISVSLHHFS